MKNRYQKEKMERRFINEMNYILNNYEKGQTLYPRTFKAFENKRNKRKSTYVGYRI